MMSSREPTARYLHSAVGVRDKLFVWGGRGGSPKVHASTLETFNVSTFAWEPQQQLNGSLPDGLRYAAVTSNGENLYSFAGNTSSGRINTLYEINSRTLLCRELLPKGSSNSPPKNEGGRSVYFQNKVVVFGGDSGQSACDDVHVFDLENRVWVVQPTTGEKPPPLFDHTFTKVDHHRAVVFGGSSGPGSRINDAYVLDMETWHWTKLDSGVKPPVRSYHDSCCIAGALTGQTHPLLLMVGGWDDNRKIHGDVWLLDVDKGEWSEVTLPEAITPRYGHCAVVFGSGASFRVVVLFGGIYVGFISETTLLCLELRGGSWQVTRVVKPDELGRPDESLREQMSKLELSPQEELQTQRGDASSRTTPKQTSTPKLTSGTSVEKSPIIDIKEVKMGNPIGQGGFGAVFEAKWRKKKVAVKVCPGNLVKNLSREIEVLTSLPPHPHVLTFFGVALSSDAVSTYIVTELAPNGSLYDYIHDKKEKPSSDQSLAWAQQIASGMQHLHNNNVVHRDLKSGNILLALGLLAKVCDFGTARTLAKTAMTTQKGTYRWMAPEIVEGVEANINKMCDVFSYGMVVYEIFSRKIPYDDLASDALVGMAVLQGKRPSIPASVPLYLRPLLEDCWKKEPNERPQFEDIVVAIQTESYE